MESIIVMKQVNCYKNKNAIREYEGQNILKNNNIATKFGEKKKKKTGSQILIRKLLS